MDKPNPAIESGQPTDVLIGEDEKRIDWMESKANEGRFEIARSLLRKGYEFGYWPKSGPVAKVHAGTLREAIDKAMTKAEIIKDKK